MSASDTTVHSIIEDVKALHLRVKIAMMTDRISTLVKFRDLALRQMAQTKTHALQQIYEEMVKDILAATQELSQLQGKLREKDLGFF